MVSLIIIMEPRHFYHALRKIVINIRLSLHKIVIKDDCRLLTNTARMLTVNASNLPMPLLVLTIMKSSTNAITSSYSLTVVIEEDNGGNELVEKKRGKMWAALDEPIVAPVAATGTSGADAEDGSLSSLGISASLQETVDLLEDEEDDEFL